MSTLLPSGQLTPIVTQSTSVSTDNTSGLVSPQASFSSSASTQSQSLNNTELHPDVTSSQVNTLQYMSVSTLNTHSMQTRSKSSIVKKKVFSIIIADDPSLTEPKTFSAASKSMQWQDAMARCNERRNAHFGSTTYLVTCSSSPKQKSCKR